MKSYKLPTMDSEILQVALRRAGRALGDAHCSDLQPACGATQTAAASCLAACAVCRPAHAWKAPALLAPPPPLPLTKLLPLRSSNGWWLGPHLEFP